MGGPPRIPLSTPVFGGREIEYLQECIETGWVAAGGPFVRKFEDAFAARHGLERAVATNSGTAALHLALRALGIGAGDEVIVPALTFVASANPIRYVGATPVFADVEPDTYTLDPAEVERLVTERTRAVMVVHLYGHPADMDAVNDAARRHGLAVIEDATEALGSAYRGEPCGLLGQIGCFSFNGNKIMTTGGGGMVLTRDDDLLERVRYLSLQAREPGTREYVHGDVGFNYAISNLHAAVGLAQLERLDLFLSAKRAIAARYRERLADVPGFRVCAEAEWAHSNFWLPSVLVQDELGRDRVAVMADLLSLGIDTRPFFTPLHMLKPYQHVERLPVAEDLHARGISLPASVDLKPDDQDRVLDALAGVAAAAAP